MKRFSIILLLLVFFLVFTVSMSTLKAADEETPPPLSIKEAGLGEGVENRTLLGAGDIFMEGSRVYFFTWVIDGKQGDYVTHVWIHEEEEKLRIELTVGGPSWRTWSYKNLHPGSAGNWSVEVRDPSGKVLESMRFKCTPRVSQ